MKATLKISIVCSVWMTFAACDILETAKSQTDSVVSAIDDKVEQTRQLASLAQTANELRTTLTPEQVRTALATPITQSDVDDAHGFLDDYRNTPAFTSFHMDSETVLDAAKTGGQGIDPSSGIDLLKSGFKLADGHKSLLIAYKQLMDRKGGPNVMLPKVTRVGGLAAAARYIAGDGDPASDAVAKRMSLERSDIKSKVKNELREANRKAREKAVALKDEAKSIKLEDAAKLDFKNLKLEDLEKLDLNELGFGNLGDVDALPTARHAGAVALAFLSPESIAFWNGLSTEQRNEILSLKEKSAKHLPAVLITLTHFSGENLVYLAGIGDLEEKTND